MGWLRLGAAILAIVAVTGLVSVPGGLGGPSATGESESVVGTASAGFGSEGPAVLKRFDGPNGTVRVKVAPRNSAGNRTIAEHVPVRHRFGSVVTTDVTREQYRALAGDPDIAIKPVQRVSLLSEDDSPVSVSWASPSDGATVDGTVQVEIDASSTESDIRTVQWRVGNGDERQATYDPDADAWTATWDAAATANGTYELLAAAVDQQGSVAEYSITVTVGDPGDSDQTTIDWRRPGENATITERTRLQIDATAPHGTIEQLLWQAGDTEPQPAAYNDTSGYWEADFDPTSIEAGETRFRTRLKTSNGVTRTDTVQARVDSSFEPPSLEWHSPSDGETIEGHHPIRLMVNDSDGELRDVRWQIEDRAPRDHMYYDSAVSGHHEDTWNTTAEDDGTYRLRAMARGEDGATAVRTITVEVDNSPTKPDVRWSTPTAGDAIANDVRLELAVDGRGNDVTGVRWQVDDGPPRNATYDEGYRAYVAELNASRLSMGVHVLRAQARTDVDALGNATIEVTVDPPDGPADGTPYGVDQLYGGTVGEPRGGEGATVAVVDTGVDPVHPDLRRSLERCVSVVGGEACADPHGHGTGLAGAVAADNTAPGGIYGIAPQADLFAYRAVGEDGGGHADDVAAAIDRAAADGADVVVLGLETPGNDSLVARAIEAHSDAVLFVAAAGNDGPRLETITPPAAHENVLAVGAIDRDARVVDDSSRGRPGDSFCACRGAIDVVAAGDRVTTTARHAGYRRLTGTSIAAAQIAGVAAKGWASGRADLNRDGTVTPAEVSRWVREHARDVTAGQETGPGYDPASGAGLPIVD